MNNNVENLHLIMLKKMYIYKNKILSTPKLNGLFPDSHRTLPTRLALVHPVVFASFCSQTTRALWERIPLPKPMPFLAMLFRFTRKLYGFFPGRWVRLWPMSSGYVQWPRTLMAVTYVGVSVGIQFSQDSFNIEKNRDELSFTLLLVIRVKNVLEK